MSTPEQLLGSNLIDDSTVELIKKMVKYSYEEINYEWEGLTKGEKEIFETKEKFDEFIRMYGPTKG